MKTSSLLGLTLATLLSVSPTSRAADKLEYNRDIRPILAENCFACHGPDSATRKKGLRLDQRDAAIEKKGIVPGKPDESKIIARIYSNDPDKVMPTPESHKKLTQKQKDTLKLWVEQGAEYQAHWSLLAPKRPTPPAVKNEAWVRTPIDRFILAELEKKGLTPAPEADRRTLARRLSLDLTGLPPAPGDVEEFVKDESPNAYEKYIDKMMSMKQWGEHRGRYWLDAARYGDTHGIHFDNYREMWSYRDWVINAFNQNMKFDQFTTEQLAGDLLPNPTVEQKVATGFNRCNITTNEGGAISEEYLVLYARDRTETASLVWMGLTTGCAVCHDHKFDPVSQKDFYALSAFFNNSTQGAMDGNIPDTPPTIMVSRLEDRPRFDAVSKEVADVTGKINTRKSTARKDFDAWVTKADISLLQGRIPTKGLTFHMPLNDGQGGNLRYTAGGKESTKPVFGGVDWKPGAIDKLGLAPSNNARIMIDEAGDFATNQAFTASTWIQIPRRGASGAFLARMDPAAKHRGWDLWFEGDRVGAHIVSEWDADAIKVVCKNPILNGRWYNVTMTYDGSGKAAGIKIYIDGKSEPFDIQKDSLKGDIRTKVPFEISQRNGEGATGSRLNGNLYQDVRLYDRALSPGEALDLARAGRAMNLLQGAKGKLAAKDADELFDYWLNGTDQEYRELTNKQATLKAEETTIRQRGTIAHIMNEKPGEAHAFILARGDYDKRKDKVIANTPQVLPPMAKDLPKNRLGLAKWLLTEEHPLTARVTVNRFWQELYGNGLVRTSGDFGITGELPSHPELLDWLAVEFRENGWDVKKFFKTLVMSAAYRQAAVATPEKIDKDPANKWLSRGPRFRMDAEMIRDYALAASGLMVNKIGGPSVKPYQPPGVWEAVAMIGSNTRDYRRDSGDNLYRRSMYTFWKRAAPPASMEILNAPNRETCTVRRERTNTPLQALVTLNDPQMVEAARRLAEVTLFTESAKTDDERIDVMAKRILSRSFKETELKIIREVLGNLKARYAKDAEEAKKLIAVGESKPDAKLNPSELAAWTMLANQLFNLDEALTK